MSLTYMIRQLLDPTTGQRFEEIDPIRGQTGSGTITIPAGAPGADVTLITVLSGKKYIMTSFSWNPVGLAVVSTLQVFEGPSATGTLKLKRQQIAAALKGVDGSNMSGYEFTSDVVARELIGGLGGTIEVGGYLVDVEPSP